MIGKIRQKNLDNLAEALTRNDTAVVKICRDLETCFMTSSASEEAIVRAIINGCLNQLNDAKDVKDILKFVDIATYLETYLPPPEGILLI